MYFVPEPLIIDGAVPLFFSTGPFSSSGYYQANSATISLPSGLTDGCLGVLMDLTTNTAGNPTDVVPSGWTQVNASLNGVARGKISAKRLAPGDSGATVTGMLGTSGNARKRLLVIQPSIPGGSWAVNGAVDAALQATNPSPLSRAKSHTGPFVGVGFAACVGGAPVQTASPTPDYGPGTAGQSSMVYWFLDPAGATLQTDMGNDGTWNYLTLQAFNYILP